MADKTKKNTSSKPSKKTTKAVAAPKAAAKSAAPRKSRAAILKTITQEERQRLVEQAAYFRAEKRGFQGNSHDDWVAAEAEVTADLVKNKVLVI